MFSAYVRSLPASQGAGEFLTFRGGTAGRRKGYASRAYQRRRFCRLNLTMLAYLFLPYFDEISSARVVSASATLI